ncbi:hypothetical protein L218DRAFT_835467, partial [Marasmius fiardii PR-910]
HFWSLDETGKTRISNHGCRYLGLPIKFMFTEHTCKQYSWPIETYRNVHRWQVCRGFDPTSPDLARYLGYPIYEVM